MQQKNCKLWGVDNGLKYICENINFKELKELDLSDIIISDIKVLEK